MLQLLSSICILFPWGKLFSAQTSYRGREHQRLGHFIFTVGKSPVENKQSHESAWPLVIVTPGVRSQPQEPYWCAQ